MAVKRINNSSSAGLWRQFVDLITTLILWAYFTLGFLVFFLLFYLSACFFAENKEIAFQRLNHLFYKGFFCLIKILIPGNSWQVDKKAAEIKSAVVICNHVSYLDPLIFISLYARHKTIVKSRFFHIPIFGWILRTAGYLPAGVDEGLGPLLIDHIEKMKEYLAGGGNLFIFPEGTRSRDGCLGPFNRGAFKIAGFCRAPIKILRITNSDKLFTPGKFLFNTGIKNKITLEFVGAIDPDYQHNPPSAAELEKLVRQALMADSC